MQSPKDSPLKADEKTHEQSYQSDAYDDAEVNSESTEQFGGFLDNIERMLEEEPLDSEQQKKSRKIALRTKLRGYKKKTENMKSLNVKKLASDHKRKKMNLQNHFQSKNNSQVQVTRRQNLFFGDDKNGSQQKFGSTIFMSKPSGLSLDYNYGCQNGSQQFKYSSEFSLDQFEMQFEDRRLIQKLDAKIPQSRIHMLTENRNPAQDYSPFNSQFGQGFHQIPISHDTLQRQQLRQNQATEDEGKRDVFAYRSPFVTIPTVLPDTNGALDEAFINRYKTQMSNPTSIYELAERQNPSTPKQKGALGDDAKSSVSMRADDEPTATTHKLSGASAKCKTPNNMVVDVLDSEDMSFDLTMQNSVVATNHATLHQ